MERLENGQGVCCVSASFCACAYVNDCCCAKENKEYKLHQKKLPPTARSAIVTSQQKGTFSNEHLRDPYRVFFQASRTINSFKKLCADYGKTDFATSVELGCL